MLITEKTSKIRTSIIEKVVLMLFFSALVLIGLIVAGDYGVAWDDHSQIDIGKQNLEYALGQNQDLFKNVDRFYGSAFELPVYFIQSHFNSFHTQVFVRHLIIYLYFLFALFIFYKLLLSLFRSFPMALLGVILLYLQPRIFAHSFFNSKDLPFLSTFIISIYTLWSLVELPTDKRRILIHAFVTAFLIDTRLIGFLVPVLSIGILGFIYIPKKGFKSKLKPIFSYFILTALFIYMLWPALWLHPLLIFRSFVRMAHFPWGYTNLIAGETVLATQNPWYYIPLWIGITTPVYLLITYFIGVYFAFKNVINNSDIFFNAKQIFIIAFALLPIDLYIFFLILKPTLYDGWRQLFFLSPLLVIGAVYGIQNFLYTLRNRKFIIVLSGVLILILAFVPAVKMILLHPYQQVHFNIFVPKKANWIRENYEMDYWGLTYKEGFEKLLKFDSSKTIKVKVANIAAIDNWKLADEYSKRIILVDDIAAAEYFITNYRFHPQEFPYKKIISIERQGSCILGVYKLKNNN